MWTSQSSTLGGPLVAATGWVDALIRGSVGTAIAIIAIVAIGMLMLAGRMPVRKAAGAILGSFILFGAPTIVGGLMTGTDVAIASVDVEDVPVEPVPIAPPPSTYPSPPPSAYDPYAGASVPQR